MPRLSSILTIAFPVAFVIVFCPVAVLIANGLVNIWDGDSSVRLAHILVGAVPVVLSVALAAYAFLCRRTPSIRVSAACVALLTLPSGFVFGILSQAVRMQPCLGLLCCLPCLASIAFLIEGWVRRFSVSRLVWVSAVAAACGGLAYGDLRFSVSIRDSQGSPVANVPVQLVHQDYWSGYSSYEVRSNSRGWAYVGFIRWAAFQDKWQIIIPSNANVTIANLKESGLVAPHSWPIRVTLISDRK
jgi:hypothetical protein